MLEPAGKTATLRIYAADSPPPALQVGGVDGYFVAAGFSGHGFALDPLTGKLLAEWIHDGPPSLDLHAFRPSHFAEGDVRRSPAAL